MIEIKDGCRRHLGFHKFAAISLLLIGFSPNFTCIYLILWPRNVIREIVDYSVGLSIFQLVNKHPADVRLCTGSVEVYKLLGLERGENRKLAYMITQVTERI
jgi:hypothetical protein